MVRPTPAMARNYGYAVCHRDNRRDAQAGFCIERKPQRQDKKPGGIEQDAVKKLFFHDIPSGKALKKDAVKT